MLATMGDMLRDRRASERQPLTLPLELACGTPAVTRDISAHGLYFFVPGEFALERWLTVEYEVPQAQVRFVAAGEVLRTEPADDRTGVAVRLHGPRRVSALDS